MKIKIPVILLIGLGLVGCGAPSADTASDLDVVVTAPSGTFDFKQARTYDSPTSVPLVKTSDTEAEPVQSTLNADLQNAILNAVNQNMTALGYRRISNPAEGTPSVFLEVSAMATTQTDVYYSSWYSTWGGYYAPWYGGTYGVGWAPVAVPYVSSSQYGSVVINMTNPNTPDPNTKTFPTLWSAAVAGLITGSGVTSTAQDRVVKGINQAFAQSSYLNNGTKP